MSRDPGAREARAPLSLPAPPPLAAPDGFAAGAAALGVSLSAEQTATLGDYLARLIAMNERVNLTRITDPADAWNRHALDALSLVPHLADLPGGGRVLDVGSGGGVPGIPLAIARPDLHVVLLEATAKKADFLRAVSSAIGLANVEVWNGRAERGAESEDRASFDAVTARGVAKIDVLLGWTVPFAKPRGLLLFIKGERAEEELAEARQNLAQSHCTHERTVRTPTGRIVLLRKA